MTTEDLALETQDIDVLGRGSLNLDTKALDGRANLVLSDHSLPKPTSAFIDSPRWATG